jgi:class 3 adenylate cyclase
VPNDFRIDFQIVNIGTEENPEIVSIPDPDRYEYINDGTDEGWLDKLDGRHLFFPIATIARMLTKSGDLPATQISPLIADAHDYIKSRTSDILIALQEGIHGATFRNITNKELATLRENKEFFVIASLDLIGSTELSQSVSAEQWARIIQVYSREVARLCMLFHGRPLKFMGDGILLYFHIGSAIRRHDLAADCALSLRDLILFGMNPPLKQLGFPELSCRVGVDSGDAYVITIGDSESLSQIDIIGHAVNIATKVEKQAGPNEICIGEAAKRKLHTMWLKHVVPLPPPAGWPYRDQDSGELYGVYKLNIPADFSL